ncbi:hypothetical protein DWH53_20920 [Escherichia coli]|nr:hypothetical protein [Escherichia coli]
MSVGFAARIFASVSAIVQPSECVKEGTNSVELGYTRNYTHTMGVMWGNLVEFGRIDLEEEHLNHGVLKRKTDLRGGPLI